MRVLGIDLAASPATTAIARLDGLTVTAVEVGVDDDRIVELAAGAAKIGIDCPLGWPRAFVDFVAAHQAGRPTSAADTVAARRPLAYRATDLWVAAHHPPLRPLSVSADRIGHAAMRAAGLLARLGETDRSGTARVVEVYPAASLRQWGMPFRGYKGPDGAALRSASVSALASVLELGPHADLCRACDHALDAVVAAASARAVELGRASGPDTTQREVATVEGWIAIPTGELAGLREG
ncbi:MAG TPA: DUF429 domain-containing protein [Jatrophihabitans sp.]|uniref:DUF429 domain-containing protein n=1 Tax=Jatrophihabitans sp. TaxID=1932789 RepID=UPI002DFE1FAD|nr:DUF429 domain-containing protein [Jatrophihabitans sp.]